MRNEEVKNWSSESSLSRVKAVPDMGVSRRLKSICQSLTLATEQGRVVESLANTENAQRINDLVEDIHEALMDYQVCISISWCSTMLDYYPRLHWNKISTMSATRTLWVSLPHQLHSQTNQ